MTQFKTRENISKNIVLRGSQAQAVATQDSRGIELLQAKENLHAV